MDVTAVSTFEDSPKRQGYRMPAEWEPHRSVWLAWPSHENLWQENLQPAQKEFVDFCKAIADIDPKTEKARGENLDILVPTLEAGAQAENALRGLPVHLHLVPFGDIWLRDTAPVFLKGPQGLASVCFHFNGWGGKYDLADDPQVALRIADLNTSKTRAQYNFPWVLEGGSVEVDGEGTCLTSRQCLLNDNRNPELTEKMIEEKLCDTLGVEKILWVGDGLLNDHTDGHIDTIARFIAPGKIMAMRALNTDDPNFDQLQKILAELEAMTDARGRKLEVILVPSPGAVLNEDGDVMPASYLNFYIGNSTVVVPTYGSPQDDSAVAAIAKHFPDRKTVGLSALAILSGGGAFHCISQQEPKSGVPNEHN